MAENRVLVCSDPECRNPNVELVDARYEDRATRFGGATKRKEVIEYRCTVCGTLSTHER